MNSKAVFATLGLLGVVIAGGALAVQTTNIEHERTEEFAKGKFEHAVVNNLGEVRLARQVVTLLEDDKDVAFVNALVVDGKGVAWAATAPAGKLFRIAPGAKPELYYQAEGKTLLSLASAGDKLYVGTGGGDGKILQITGKNTAQLILDRKDLAYVWSMVVLPNGNIVAGTGPKGELLLVEPGDKPVAGEVLFASEKAKQKNILSVTAAGNKTVYFGTDTDGLVFRFDMEAKKAFLLFDANEAEIADLKLAADGTLYAATSDPRQGAGGAAPAPQREGRPSATQPGNGNGSGQSTQPAMIIPPDVQLRLQSLPPEVREQVLQRLKERMRQQQNQPEGQGGFEGGSDRLRQLAGTPGAPAQSDELEGHVIVEAVEAPAAADEQEEAEAPTTQPEEQSEQTPQPRNGEEGGPPPEMLARMREAMARRGGGEGGSSGGNAVYAIDANGFVDEVLRQPTMMLSLLLEGDRVIVGTGAEGRVLSVKPGTEEIVTLVRMEDVKQVLTIAAAPGGGIYVGTANKAVIAHVGPDYARTGAYTGTPVDAKQIARWGVIQTRSRVGKGEVKVQTRSGNLAEPDDKLWSAWSDAVDAADGVTITSPPARFLQYRLQLSTSDASSTPIVDAVQLAFSGHNQAPKVAAIKAVVPGAGGGSGGGEEGPSDPRSAMLARLRGGGGGGEEAAAAGGAVMVMWQAVDPNGDPMEFTLAFQRDGTSAWVPLTPDPVREPKFRWATRGVPDGRYRIRVTASDKPGNPAADAMEASRETETFLVDNTPPVINNFRVLQNKDGQVVLAADPSDALTRLSSATVTVNSVGAGQVIAPTDGVWDEREEGLRFTVDLSDQKGPSALLILTVSDAAGNSTTAALEVEKK